MPYNKVAALCKARGLTIAELERDTCIGNGTIGRWTKSSPRVDTLKKVADYFGVTMDELVSEDADAPET